MRDSCTMTCDQHIFRLYQIKSKSMILYHVKFSHMVLLQDCLIISFNRIYKVHDNNNIEVLNISSLFNIYVHTHTKIFSSIIFQQLSYKQSLRILKIHTTSINPRYLGSVSLDPLIQLKQPKSLDLKNMSRFTQI